FQDLDFTVAQLVSRTWFALRHAKHDLGDGIAEIGIKIAASATHGANGKQHLRVGRLLQYVTIGSRGKHRADVTGVGVVRQDYHSRVREFLDDPRGGT